MRTGVIAKIAAFTAAGLQASLARAQEGAAKSQLPQSFIDSQDLLSSEISPEYRILLTGLVIFFLAVLILCVSVLVSRRLSRLVAARTAELEYEVLDKARALEAHVESEDRFRALIEQASDGIFIADP